MICAVIQIVRICWCLWVFIYIFVIIALCSDDVRQLPAAFHPAEAEDDKFLIPSHIYIIAAWLLGTLAFLPPLRHST